MMKPKSFTERFLLCYMQLGRREGAAISFEELTRRISKQYGQKIAGTTVTRWRDGTEPQRDHCEAAAHVFGVDPGWLMFGEDSKAPAPAWLDAPDSAPARRR